MKCRSWLSGISVALISEVATWITCSQTASDFKLTSDLSKFLEEKEMKSGTFQTILWIKVLFTPLTKNP